MIIAGGVIPTKDYRFLFDAGASGVFDPETKIADATTDILEKLIKQVPQ